MRGQFEHVTLHVCRMPRACSRSLLVLFPNRRGQGVDISSHTACLEGGRRPFLPSRVPGAPCLYRGQSLYRDVWLRRPQEGREGDEAEGRGPLDAFSVWLVLSFLPFSRSHGSLQRCMRSSEAYKRGRIKQQNILIDIINMIY